MKSNRPGKRPRKKTTAPPARFAETRQPRKPSDGPSDTGLSRLRSILEAEPACVKIVSSDGRLLDINPAGLAMIEADSTDQVLGHSLLPLVAPEYREEFASFTRRVAEGGSGVLEFEIIGLRGTRRWLESHAVSFVDRPGDPSAALSVTRDITERKLTEGAWRAVIEGVAGASGKDFFLALCRRLTTALQVQYAFISQVSSESSQFLCTAGWGRGVPLPPFQVSPDGPCDIVLHGKFLHHPDRLPALYPYVRVIPEWGVVSYCGVPITGRSGQVIGHVAIADDKPMPDARLATALLQVFAARVASEQERLQTEEEIRRREEQLASLIHTVEGIVWEANPNTFCFSFVSEQAERILGYPAMQWLNDPNFWTDRLHPEDRDDTVAYCVQQTKLGRPHEFEYRMIASDGRVVWLRDLVTVIMQDGRPATLRGIMVDITARKQVEETLALHSRVLENMREGVSLSDEQGFICYTNPAKDAMFGYAPGELIGRHITALNAYTPGENARIVQGVIEQLKREGSWAGEFSNRRKDGTPFTTFARITALEISGKMYWVSVQEDVTERKQLEEELRQAQKMEAVGRLAGGIAHDFNNLLTVILGCSEMLLQRMSDGDQLKRYPADIHQAGDRAAALIQQLLAFSRRQYLRPFVVNLNDVVSRAEGVLRRLIGEDIELSADLDPGLLPVSVDPVQIEQVLLNLAVNARDAMPQGGQLRFKTANVEIAPGDPAYAQVSPGRYAVLSVSDSGIGMDAEIRAHIFEPFFTTKGIGKGTGLGLATVYGIVKQSGGYISVESEPGQGTTFTMQLPCCEATEVPVDPVSVPTADVPKGCETVLLVEDEPEVRQLAAAVLRECGYTVLEAPHGPGALSLAASHPEIDLLLTDVVMPQMNGRELADKLLRTHAGLAVLFMSGYTGEVVLKHGVQDAGSSLLYKPFSYLLLAQKVRAILDAR